MKNESKLSLENYADGALINRRLFFQQYKFDREDRSFSSHEYQSRASLLREKLWMELNERAGSCMRGDGKTAEARRLEST